MKKIVILTGSPRKNGNSSRMADAFAAAAEAKGFSISRFDTAFLKIAGCRACNGCFSKGRACVVDDDFNQIAAALLEADGVVFVAPVYWYTFPAQIKAAIDRLYSLCVAGKNFAGKRSALISCCEEEDMATFTGVSFAYEKTVALLQYQDVGRVLIPGVNEPGAITATDGEARAAALVEQFC